MQRERIEYSNVPLGRAEPEDEVDVNAGDCQALLPCAHSDPSHENASERLKEEVIVCVVDPTEKDKANLTATKSSLTIRKGGGNVLFLNGLRGLAALMVVQQHLETLSGFWLGLVAVDVFFVLSAFLLTMLFERKCRQLLAQRAPLIQWIIMLADYFCKRFLRVYPLLIFVSLLLTQVSARIYNVDRPYSAYEVLTLKFEARYFVLWTLAIEIEYYFIIPVFVAVVVALRRHWWVLVLPLYAWVIYEGIYTYRMHHQPLRPHLSTFVTGSLAAVVYSRLDQWIKNNGFVFTRRNRLAIRVFEGIAFCHFMSAAFRGLIFHWVFDDPFGNTGGLSFVSVPVSVLIVIEMLLPSALARSLEVNLLCYAGKISFSIYLLHPFVIHSLLIKSQVNKFDKFVLNFGGTMLLATATYWAVEYPSQLTAQYLSKLLARVGTRSISLERSREEARQQPQPL